MKEIDFYQLDRTAQERFVGSVNGRGLPLPILKMASKSALPLILRGASAVCIAVALVLAVVGYGSLGSRMAIQGVGSLVLYVALTALATLGFLVASARAKAYAGSPFKHGVYVFPTGLIDARTAKLRLHPMDDFRGLFGPDVRGLTVDFGGTSFSFPVTDPAEIAAVKEGLDRARGALGEAAAQGDSVRPRALAALDPLQGYANPLASSDRLTQRKFGWGASAFAIAALVGVVVGAPVWLVRNVRSDEAMFARAAAADDRASYEAYLAVGSRHAAEVSALLLPRAELHEAEKVGTVEAIEQFMKDHPTGQVVPLARASLKAALLAELETAAKAGTLAALNDFAKSHDHALVEAELSAARHAVYQAALARYAAVGPDKSSAAALLVQRLVAWSEVKGPRVDVRFHTKRSKTLDRADRAASQSRQFKGVVSIPSRYFDDAAEKAERDAFVADVAKRFTDVFTPEILSLTAGDPVTDPDAALPAQVTVPTLFVEPSVVWAGAIQASHQPRGVFIGVDMVFDAVFRTPDASKPVTVKMDMWRVPELAAAKDSDAPEPIVYAAMRGKAFEQFEKKLLGTFFAK